MSLAAHESQEPSGASSVHSPPRASGKATPAPPKLSGDGNVELQNVQLKLPIEEDIMQLARLGEVGAIQKLFDSGQFDAKYKDEEGLTPLHWAAINNHYALCKYLIESGADVNAKGGESVATPAMWAAQRCHYYVVNLLLQNGADTLLTDAQGYNVLHLATFDGNIFLLILLLHQNIPVDTPDLQGHTCLMWAAYKGYPAYVDLFLRWGASVNTADENGFTALHWALVKGSQGCIHKMVEYGSDRFAQTSTQKTPAVVAEEMRTTRMWHRALIESGYDEDGNPKGVPFPYGSFLKQRGFISRSFFVLPFIELYVIISILSYMVVFAAVPIAVFLVCFIQWAAQQVLQWAPSDMRHVHRTPFLAGVFAASGFWVGARWLTTILPNTYSTHLLLNILFGVCYSLCMYFYIYSMVEDPGYVPKLGSRNQQKAVIEELLGLWKFDDQSFCVYCMNRMPMRSKHCKRCGRCIAKHDHHCPWINNCVGVNNLRHFFLYILFLEVGILFLIQLVLVHIESLPTPPETQCNILAEAICSIILKDTFTVVLSMWASLQLAWVTMLLVVQLVQIARGKTTYESMGGHSNHHGNRASEAITSALTAGTTTLSGAQLTGSGMASDPTTAPGYRHPHAHGEGWFAQWKKLLGLDTFMATAQDGLNASGGHTRRQQNPFSRGVVRNCKDFWCDPAPYFGKRESGAAMLDGDVVNYARMYEPPPRMKLRRSRQDGDSALYHTLAGDDAV